MFTDCAVLDQLAVIREGDLWNKYARPPCGIYYIIYILYVRIYVCMYMYVGGGVGGRVWRCAGPAAGRHPRGGLVEQVRTPAVGYIHDITCILLSPPPQKNTYIHVCVYINIYSPFHPPPPILQKKPTCIHIYLYIYIYSLLQPPLNTGGPPSCPSPRPSAASRPPAPTWPATSPSTCRS